MSKADELFYKEFNEDSNLPVMTDEEKKERDIRKIKWAIEQIGIALAIHETLEKMKE